MVRDPVGALERAGCRGCQAATVGDYRHVWVEKVQECLDVARFPRPLERVNRFALRTRRRRCLGGRAVEEVFHPDAVFHTPLGDAVASQTVTNAWTMLIGAFPDIQVTVEDVISDGSKIVCRDKVTGLTEATTVACRRRNCDSSAWCRPSDPA